MRVRIFFSTLFLLMFNVAITYAQIGEPCGGTDPDATCPLDTWVVVLAVIAVTGAALHLRNKQKSPLQKAEGIN